MSTWVFSGLETHCEKNCLSRSLATSSVTYSWLSRLAGALTCQVEANHVHNDKQLFFSDEFHEHFSRFSDPDIRNPDPDPGGQKLPTKVDKILEISWF
jgi:hypothetical protein